MLDTMGKIEITQDKVPITMRWELRRKHLEIYKFKASLVEGKPTEEPEKKQ